MELFYARLFASPYWERSNVIRPTGVVATKQIGAWPLGLRAGLGATSNTHTLYYA